MLPLNTIVPVIKSSDRREIHEWAESNHLYSRSFYDNRYEFDGYYVSEICDGCGRRYSSIGKTDDTLSCSTCGFHCSYCNFCSEGNGFDSSLYDDKEERQRQRVRVYPRNNVIIVSQKKIKNKGYYQYL